MNELFDRKQQQQRLEVQQEQQLQAYHVDEEEYLSAQRAAIEAIHVGRATLEEASKQGEQLNRAESAADETQYSLDKATRLLRGMTWSGWIANKFTCDVKKNTAEDKQQMQRRPPPLVYDQDSLPSCTRDVTQAIQNYHANINVLEACETEEQKSTCQHICNIMCETAHKAIAKFQEENINMDSYALEFALDFKALRERQLASQKRIRGLEIDSHPAYLGLPSPKSSATTTVASRNAFSSSLQNDHLNHVFEKQEIHLNVMAQSLGELNHIANSLSTEVSRQHEVIDSIDSKGESALETSRMVTRRAERIIRNKSWSPTKPIYSCQISIRHQASGKYLSISQADKTPLVLISQFNPDTCSFFVWRRQGNIFGIQNKITRKWAGQSMLGSICCQATSFNQREEWEADFKGSTSQNFTSQKITNDIRLLIASAGWGQGAYLAVSPSNHSLGIGGSAIEERKNADRWCITNMTFVEE